MGRAAMRSAPSKPAYYTVELSLWKCLFKNPAIETLRFIEDSGGFGQRAV
jgi:hypothetical protein